MFAMMTEEKKEYTVQARQAASQTKKYNVDTYTYYYSAHTSSDPRYVFYK